MSQRNRTLQETTTSHSPAEVLQAAKDFFGRQTGIYAAMTFMAKGAISEVVIAAFPGEGGTKVTGSTYLFDQQIARFFATLAPVPLAVATESGE